uniref:Uncharacterized protein n=1 Tax=Coccidioides posadasii RMSCC 3488 TaxID=454284 RepID=A0A0J6FD68_COCPO|nr:hypothetical protein CPAG_03132 [Coccidioides posadasii RMSCC 3488]
MAKYEPNTEEYTLLSSLWRKTGSSLSSHADVRNPRRWLTPSGTASAQWTPCDHSKLQAWLTRAWALTTIQNRVRSTNNRLHHTAFRQVFHPSKYIGAGEIPQQQPSHPQIPTRHPLLVLRPEPSKNTQLLDRLAKSTEPSQTTSAILLFQFFMHTFFDIRSISPEVLVLSPIGSGFTSLAETVISLGCALQKAQHLYVCHFCFKQGPVRTIFQAQRPAARPRWPYAPASMDRANCFTQPRSLLNRDCQDEMRIREIFYMSLAIGFVFGFLLRILRVVDLENHRCQGRVNIIVSRQRKFIQQSCIMI